MATDDLLSDLIGRNTALFAGMELFKDQQAALAIGTADDPDSFNSAGGKTGDLGYYPITNASGQTVYKPCAERQQLIIADQIASGDLKVELPGPTGAPFVMRTLGEDIGGDFLNLASFGLVNSAADVLPQVQQFAMWAASNIGPDGKPPKIVWRQRGIMLFDGELTVPWSNFWFEGAGDDTVIKQLNPKRGPFRLLGGGATLKGFRAVYEEERQLNNDVAERYYGFAAFQREGIMVHGSNNLLEHVVMENRSTGFCFIGLPRLISTGGPASESNTEAEIDYSLQAVGNTMLDCVANNCDLGVTGHGQKDWTIEITGKVTTNVQQIPPHIGYIEPKGIGQYRAFCTNVKFTGDSSENIYSNAFKFEAITGLDFSCSAHRCAGGIVMNLCNDGTVELKRLTEGLSLGTDVSYALQVTTSSDIAFKAGLVKGGNAQRLIGGLFRRGCRRVSLDGMKLVTNHAVVSPQSGYRVQSDGLGANDVTFSNVAWHRVNADGSTATPTAGGDPAMFIAGNTDDVVTIINPVQSGNYDLLDGVGKFKGVFNSSLLDGRGAPIIDMTNLALSVTDSRSEQKIMNTALTVGNGYGLFNSGTGAEPASYVRKYFHKWRVGRNIFLRYSILLPASHGLTGNGSLQIRWPDELIDTGSSVSRTPQSVYLANVTIPAGSTAAILPNPNTKTASLITIKDGVSSVIRAQDLSTSAQVEISGLLIIDTDDAWLA